MSTNTNIDLSKLTPAQLQAILAAAGGQAKGGADDLPDIDNAREAGPPPLPEGVFDLEIQELTKFDSQDPNLPTVPMFRASFKIVEVVACAPQRPVVETIDKNPPPAPVQVGEIRRWQAPVSAHKNHAQNLVRVRHLLQAALRFDPGSSLAESAVMPDGITKVSWVAVMREALDVKNPLAGRKIRATVTRILTQRGKGFAMYIPTFSVPPGVELRTDAIVRSF